MHKVRSEITGSVWKVEVAVGQTVAEGDTLVIVESMKMEIPISAPASGVLTEILIAEGEPVADARRMPRIEAFRDGQRHLLQEAQTGPLAALPDLPAQTDATSTAAYIQAVLDGALPVPAPIAQQVEHILRELVSP